MSGIGIPERGARNRIIAMLEVQLAKYHQLKRGLMQQLLTGGIRLI